MSHFLENLTWQECGILSLMFGSLLCLLVAAWGDRRNERQAMRGERRFDPPRRWDQDLK